jgi:serine/threonine protein kinase
MGTQLLSALSFLHQRRIVHRDLKTENVILADVYGDRVKLVDFGLAAYETDEKEMQRRCGSPGYVAPEVLQNRQYGCPADCFSMGVLLYILVSGLAPFSGKDVPTVLRRTVKCQVTYKENDFSPNASACLRKLLTSSPDTRMTAKEAGAHEWFATHNEVGELDSSLMNEISFAGGAGHVLSDVLSEPEDEGEALVNPEIVQSLKPVWAEVQKSLGANRSQHPDLQEVFSRGANSVHFVQGTICGKDLSDDHFAKAIAQQGFKIDHMIGVGVFSKVFAASKQGCQDPVAVKWLLTTCDMLFERERGALQELRHPNLVGFLGVLDAPLNGFILELCSGGSLFQLLHLAKNRIAQSLSLKQRVAGALDIASGLAYMHQQGFMHRDVKSSNCLLERVPESATQLPLIKLGDFGLSREVVDSISTNPTKNTGTPGYMAPEVMQGKAYNTSADIFSFSHVLYELASLKLPYGGKDVRIAVLIVRGLRPRLHDESGQELFPPDLVMLMEKGWHADASARPSAASLWQPLHQYSQSAP